MNFDNLIAFTVIFGFVTASLIQYSYFSFYKYKRRKKYKNIFININQMRNDKIRFYHNINISNTDVKERDILYRSIMNKTIHTKVHKLADIELVKDESNSEKNKKNTVVEDMENTKRKNQLFIHLITLPFILLNIYVNIHYLYTVIIIIINLVIFFNQAIFKFRIKKGYYGTNEYECREIIEYLTNNSNKNCGPKSNKIFLDDESLDKLSYYFGQILVGKSNV